LITEGDRDASWNPFIKSLSERSLSRVTSEGKGKDKRGDFSILVGKLLTFEGPTFMETIMGAIRASPMGNAILKSQMEKMAF